MSKNLAIFDGKMYADLDARTLIKFGEFLVKYRDHEDSRATLIDIPNNTYGRHMVSIYRKYLVRQKKWSDYSHKYVTETIRLRGRGPRKDLTSYYNAVQSLRHDDSQRFSLYHHFDL